MSNSVAALTGVVANMAALETEFQTNWIGLDFMKTALNSNIVVRTNLAAGKIQRLYVRSSIDDGSGNPVWFAHEDGDYTIPAKTTTAADEWSQTSYFVGNEYTGAILWCDAAATVNMSTTDSR